MTAFLIILIGWITIIFVIPNLLFWLAIYWFRSHTKEPEKVTCSPSQPEPELLEEIRCLPVSLRDGVNITTDSVSFLSEIRFQASEEGLEVLRAKSYWELLYRRDRLSAMMFYLSNNAKNVPRIERQNLRDLLGIKKQAVETWLSIYNQEEMQQFQKFQHLATAFKKHNSLGVNAD